MLIMLFFGKWAALIPMATLAGILVVVAYNMRRAAPFYKAAQEPEDGYRRAGGDVLLTVLVDLTVAIQAGWSSRRCSS